MTNIPLDHPRYKSLMARHLVQEGVLAGITNMTGLVAQGRGEAFDYLLGEKTHSFSEISAKVAAAIILCAKKVVISVNGNTSVLVPDEIVSLAKATNSLVEINLFHDEGDRREKIAKIFRDRDIDILGVKPDAKIEGLTSDRAKVDSKGIFDADVVIVSLEDGDRTEILVQGGKTVIAIDLNPLSRTPQKSHVPIIDNVQRALPLIEKYYFELKNLKAEELNKIINSYDKNSILALAEKAIRQGS